MNHSKTPRSVASTSSTISKIKNPTRRSRAKAVIGRAIKSIFEPLEERRMLASGALDTTFGPILPATGKVTFDFPGGQDDGFAVASLPDGGAVVAGSFSNAFGIARFAPDGSVMWSNRTPIGSQSVASAMVLSGEQIILAGFSVGVGSAGNNFAVARYNQSDGALDMSFGPADTGYVTTDISAGADDRALGVAIDSLSNIVVAGWTGAEATRDFAVVRYTSDGALDSSFGGSGIVTTNFGSSDQAQGVVIDGSTIVAAGKSGGSMAAARYLSNGVLDPGFAGTGKFTTDLTIGNDEARAIAKHMGGYILAGTTSSDFAVARITSAGALDGSFGTGGKVTIDFFGHDDQANAVVVQSNDRIVVAGVGLDGLTQQDFAVARLMPGGTLDTTFGTGGKTTVDFTGTSNDVANGVALSSGGKIYVAGFSQSSPDVFAIARLQGNTAPVLASQTVHLETINEDETSNDGDSVESIIAHLSANGNLTDSDFDSETFRIAIGDVDDADNGVWEYSLGAGAPWQSLSGVSAHQARLLDGSARVRFVPAPDANTRSPRSASLPLLRVTAADSTAGPSGSLVDTVAFDGNNSFSSATANVDIEVEAVNDAPTFTSGPIQTAVGNSDTHTFVGWAKNISAGPADEQDQTLHFVVSVLEGDSAHPVLIGTPTIDPHTGTLQFTVGANVGSAQITVTLLDDGGTERGGREASAPSISEVVIISPRDRVVVSHNWSPVVDVGASGLSFGDTVVDPTGASLTYGVDAYSTIQEGVNFVNNGGIVIVLDGNYIEQVSITHGLTLQGQTETGVLIEAGGGALGGGTAITVDAPGQRVKVKFPWIHDSQTGLWVRAGTIDIDHSTFVHNGYDGTPFPASMTAAQTADFYSHHASDGAAILIEDSTVGEISNNNIHDNDTGVVMRRVVSANEVHHNQMSRNLRGGITLFDGSNGVFHDNTITENKGPGVVVDSGITNSFSDNFVVDNDGPAFVLFNPKELSMARGIIRTNNGRAFFGDGSTNQWPAAVYATGRTYTGGRFALEINGAQMTDNGSGGNPGGSVGVYLDSSLGEEGIVIAGHAIAGHTTAIRSSASNLTISNNALLSSVTGLELTGGSDIHIDNNTFGSSLPLQKNQTDLRVTGGSVASFTHNSMTATGTFIDMRIDNRIDAVTTRLDAKLGSEMSPAELYAAEDKIVHGVDATGSGFIRVRENDVFVTQSSGSIQRGVDSALSGDTVHVNTGTFTEQLSIVAKHLTIIAGGDLTVLQSPTVLATKFTTASGPHHPIVYVGDGGRASIHFMKIDGIRRGGGNARFEGIAFSNAGGEVDHVTITGISEDPLNGVQSGVGIYANNTDGVTRDLTISNNTISGYQKNGMSLSGAGLTAIVTGNTVTGAGPTSVIGQNGIQVSSGARGIINGNTVTGNIYTPQTVASVGILIFGAAAGSSASNNIVGTSDVGIYVISTPGNTVLDGNDISGSTYDGIFVDGGDATVSGNFLHDNIGAGGGGGGGILSFTSNQIHHNGTDGLEIWGDSDPSSVVPTIATISSNDIHDNSGSGISFHGDDVNALGVVTNVTYTSGSITNNFITSNHNGGIFIDTHVHGAASLVVQNNSISRNSDADSDDGMDNRSDERVIANGNWWGTINGPKNAANHYNQGEQGNAVRGEVDFAPWLASGVDTLPAVAGFQPSSATFAPITNDAHESFSTIQAAIDGTSPGGVITLAIGHYNESNIRVDKPLTIQGQTRNGVILGPSIEDGHINSAFAGPVSNAFIIQSSDVTIRTMSIDGNADGTIAGDHNFRAGIITDHRTGVVYNHETIQDVSVAHTYRRGIQLYSSTGGTKSVGHLISGNLVEDVILGPGIAVFDTDAILINNDVITIGAIQYSAIEAVQVSAPDGMLVHVDGNRISGGTTGITLVVPAAGSSVSANHFISDGTDTVGIIVRNALGTVTIDGNDINVGEGTGIELFGNSNAAQPVIVSNNAMRGVASTNGAYVKAGIFMSDDGTIFVNGDGDPVPNLPSYATITGNTIQGFDNGIVASSSTQTISAVLNGNTVIGDVGGSSGVGIAARGVHTVVAVFSGGTCLRFATGVEVDGADVSLHAVGIYDNVVGVRITHDGRASMDGIEFSGGGVHNTTDLFVASSAGPITLTNNHFAASGLYIDAHSSQNVDATTNTFAGKLVSSADKSHGWATEDKIHDGLDDPNVGYYKLQSGFIYATAPATGTPRLQRANDVATPGDIVEIQNGVYPGNTIITRPLTLRGESQGGVTLLPNFVGADTGGGSLAAGSSNVILVQANNVSIQDLTVDGDNPFLHSGILVNGADIDARNGIITNHPTGVFNNLAVHDVTVKNIFLRGIYASSGGSFNFTHNTVDNVAANPGSIGIFNFGGSGIIANNTVSRANDAISANNSTGTQFLNNIVTQSASGVHSDNNGSGGVGVADVLQGNHVSDGSADSYGVWVFNPYLNVTVSNNTVSNVDVGLAAAGGASALLGHDVLIIFDQNNVDLADRPGSVGAYVTDSLFGFGFADVHASFVNNNDIANADTGIFVEKNSSHNVAMNAIGNIRSIHGNHIGIDVTGGAATITDNRLYDNDIAIRVSGGGSASITGNRFSAIPEAGGFQGPANRIDLVIEHDAGLISPMHGNAFAGDHWFIRNLSSQAIDATGNTFDAANNFRIEDRILHAMDDTVAPSLGLGLVTWVANNLYVTNADTDHSIQHAIDIASSGNVVNVEAGTYLENLIVTKSLTIRGANSGISATSPRGPESSIAPGSGVAFFIGNDAPSVTIDGVEAVGDTGVQALAILAGVAIPKFLDISSSKIVASGDGVSIVDGVAIPRFITITASAITAGGTGVTVDGASGVAIPKFIDITSSALRTGHSAVVFSSSSRARISGNTIRCDNGDCLVGDGVYGDVTIEDNTITASGGGGRGIYIAGQTSRTVTKTRSNIQNNRVTASGNGVVLSDVDGDIDITGNDVTSTDTGATGIDISLQRSSPATKSSSNIQNNFVRAPGSGISFFNIDADFEVSRNTIHAGDTGVRVEGLDGSIDFGGPLEADGDDITASSYGIFAVDVTGSVTARHERLAEFSNWGIQVTAYSDNVQISDNLTTSSESGSGGIYVSNLNTAKVIKTRSNIQNNRVTTQTTGVWIEELQDDLDITGNDITVDDGTGMLLTNYYAVGDTTIFGNSIYAARAAIADFDRDGNLDIASNTITGGFEASILITGMTGGDVVIDGNHVTNTDPSAFAIRAVDVFGNVGMHDNFIASAGDGISLDGIAGHVVLIGHDFESVGTAFDARHLFGGVTARGNQFGHGGGGGGGLAGISIADSSGPVVIGGSGPGEGNTFDGVTSGVYITDVPDVTVTNNTMIEVVLAIAVGQIIIASGAVHSAHIDHNTITSADTGISIYNLDSATVTNNTISNSASARGTQGIAIDNVPDVTVSSDTLIEVVLAIAVGRSAGDPGLVYSASITHNTITNVDQGISISHLDTGEISDNVVSASRRTVRVENCGSSAPVVMARNSMTLPPWIVPTLPGAQDSIGIQIDGTSGPAAVIIGNGNRISNGKYSLELDGAVSIAGNTLADLSLDGSPDRYILLTNGALHGQEIDAKHTQFEGGGAGLKDYDANFALEDKITHATDDASVGFIRVYDGKVFVTQNSGSIQRGLNVGVVDDTVHVSPGTFTEAVTVYQRTSLVGSGADKTHVSNPGGPAITVAASGTVLNNLRTRINDLEARNSAYGFYFDSAVSHVTLENIAATSNGTGIEIHNSAVVRDLVIPAFILQANTTGFRVATTGQVNGMTMSGGTITGNTYGIYTNASSAITNNQIGFTDIHITDTQISDNVNKGIYWEKADHTEIINSQITHNGTAGAFSAGIDINLKYGIYSVMKLQQIMANANGLGDLSNGVGITIKGRNDAPSYAANPASLSGVTLDDVTIDGSPIDLSVGNNVASISFDDVEFDGSGVGAVFYSGPRQTTDLAGSRFAGSLAAYVINAQPGIIDVRSSIFGGVPATTATPQQQFAIADKILDGVDVGGFGLVRTKTDNVYVTTNSFYPPLGTTEARLQRGVDIAHVGDTVNVNGGSYDGGVVVDQSLAFVGYGIVTVSNDDANVNMVNFVVNSIQVSIDNFAFVGNAAATTSVGIMLGNGAHHASILNSSFSGHTTAIETSPTGVHHVFVWNSQLDLGSTSEGIVLRNTHDDLIQNNQFHGGARDVVVAGSNQLTSIDGNSFTDGGTAISIEDSVDVAFTNNVVTNATDTAIVISGSDHVLISSNDISVDTGKTWTRIRAGLAGNAGGATDIINNLLAGQPNVGVIVEAGYTGTLHMHTNSMTGASGAALENDSTALIDASGNWWGSENGPETPLNTWGGTPKGQVIIGSNIIIAPWLGDGIDSDPAARGFQHAAPADTTGPDASAPDLTAASDSGASDHDDITNDATPTFVGTAEPGATVHLMEGSTDRGSTFADASGHWTITSTELSPGEHLFQIIAVDTFGNTGPADPGELTVYIDTASPIVNAGADQMVFEGDLVSLDGSFVDNGGFGPYSQGFEVVAGPPVIIELSAIDPSRASFTYNDDGTVTIAYTVTDAAGNSGSDELTVVFQNSNPVLSNIHISAPIINENGMVTITGDISDAGADSFTLLATWDEGASQSEYLLPVGTTHFQITHQYLDDSPTGTPFDIKHIGLLLVDDDGGSDSEVVDLRVLNVSTVISTASILPSVDENGIVTLTGTFTDPGTLDTFSLAINWGNGESQIVSLAAGTTSFSVDHQYLDDSPSGTSFDIYTVHLTLTDDDTGSDTASVTTRVNNVAPTLSNVTVTPMIDENGTVALEGDIHDPGSLDTFDLTVNWGESTDVYHIGAGATHFHVTHQYHDDNPTGTSSDLYTIGLTLADDDGGADTATTSTTVNNVAPILHISTSPTVNENGILTVHGTILDPGSEDTFTLVVNWGEGSPQTVTLSAGTGAFDISHRYLDDNPTGSASDLYTISATLSDDDGGNSADSTSTTVTNVSPSITSLTVTPSIDENGIVALNGAFTDPGTLDTYTLTVNWGPGESTETFTLPAGQRTFSLTHQYLNDNPPGTPSDVYQIDVDIRDDDTGSAHASVTTTVNNVAPTITNVTLDHDTINENGLVMVSGTFTDPGTQDTHVVSINWGDGTTSLANVDQASRTFTATHRFLDDNPSGTSSDEVRIEVTCTDLDTGTRGPTAVRLTVNNVSPTVSINGAPSSSPEGTLISLTNTIIDPGSRDTFTYAWTVTKNGAPYTTGSSSSFSFTPNDNATYVVGLTVNDDDLGVGGDSRTITVTDVAPTIALSGNTHVNEGAVYTLTLGAVTDPGTDTIVTYYINWGDSSPTLDEYSTPGPKTHVYADGPATRSIVVSLADEDGIHPNAGTFTVTVDNVAPTATFGNFGSVNEGSSGFVIFTSPSDPSGGDVSAGFKYSYDFNNDGVFETGNGTYGGGVFSNSATVPASFLADGPGSRIVHGRISDRDGGFTDYTTTININNVAPIVNAGPDANSGVNAFFTQSGNFTDPGTDSPWSIYVNYNYDPVTNPGLGSLSQSGGSKNFVLSHFYNTAGTYDVRVTVVDKDGASGFDDVILTVANTRFQVLSLTPTVSGFDVRFNRAANASLLNLYDGLDGTFDQSDVSFFGAATGSVRGSLVWSPQSNIASFVKTGGALPADNYTVTLASRTDGWTDSGGEWLDGDFDNIAGGDYSATFAVAVSGDRVVGMPDFARGPGQTVNIPVSGSGIPIRIDNAAGLNAVDLDVVYDGFILNVTGATLAPGMPGDWSITTNLVTNGILKITVNGVTTLPAGARDLITLHATVLPNAPYGNSEVIRIQNLSVNGGFIGSRADSVIHKNTFLGDASGNAALSSFDASLISRVVVSLDTGFDNAGLTDPVIVADVNSNGVIDGLDASWVVQKGQVPASRPEIPNVPAATITTFSGIDPTFAMPLHVPASPGSAVTVPLSVVDSSEGMIALDIDVNYITGLLDVAGSDVAMGSYFASAGWNWFTTVDDSLGLIKMGFYRTTFMGPGTGSMADITFHVPLSAGTGETTLDVAGAPNSETGLSYTYVDGSIAIDASTPVISGTSGDDSYYIRHGSSDDSIEVYNGTSAGGTLMYSAPAGSLNTLTFDTGAGNDRVIVDQRLGSALPPGGIIYNAGADNDSLTIVGDNSGAASYQPSATSGSGSFAAAGSHIAFSGVEPLTASGFATLQMITPNATDVLSIDTPAVGQNRVSGTSGGTSLSPLTFFNVPHPIIDTAANDAGGGSDSITISSDGLGESGLTLFSVNAGTGANTLTINGGTLPLDAIAGLNLAVTAKNSSLVNLVNSQTLQSLAINNTAQVNLAAGHNSLQLGSLTLSTTSKLDLTDGSLRVSDTAAFSTIRSYIRNARNGGTWDGNGITSNLVAGQAGKLSLASVIRGGDVLVQPAVIGDLNLDGSTTIFDFIALSSNFNQPGVWATGDLNYDDVTTIADFIALASHFNQSFSGSATPVFAASAESITADPEPAVTETTPQATTQATATPTPTATPTKTAKKAHSRRAARHHRASPHRQMLFPHRNH